MRREQRRKDFRVEGSLRAAVIVAVHHAHYTKIRAHGRPLPRLKATTRSASRPNRRAFRPGHRNHNGQMLAFVYFEVEPVGGEASNAGRGAADCDQRGEAAGVAWGL